jgi:hypothetical protein
VAELDSEGAMKRVIGDLIFLALSGGITGWLFINWITQ